LNFLSFAYRSRSKAAFWLFAAFIVAHLVVLFAVLGVLFPDTMRQQWAAGPVAIILVMLACNVVFCFGEYLFHRYLLHMEAVRLLGRLCTSHLAHHKLTPVLFDDKQQTVRSEYAITTEEDDHFATFPPWALVAFLAFWTPFFAVIAFSFPGFPILIGGYIALAIAHFLYETIHVAHHLPYETWWKPRIERGGLSGSLLAKMHGFHVAHHANYKCNMNLAGFFGIPLADLVLGTYKQPDPMLLDGTPATKAVARELTPNPHWPISVFDSASVKRRRRMQKEADARKAARNKARVAGRTPTGDDLAAASSRVHD
jgi:hypothetical protein